MGRCDLDLTNNQGQTLDSGTLQNGYNALDAGCLEDGCYTLRSGRHPRTTS